MSPKLFRYSYYSILIFLRITFWLVILLFIKYSYSYYESSDIISFLKEIRQINNHIEEIWEIIKPWLIEFAYFIAKLISISIITFLIKNCPLPHQMFISWDENNQITSIFGRMIAQHLRTNYYVSLKEFAEIHKNSTIEAYYTTHHFNKGKISSFLTKYDTHYQNDILKK